MLDRFSPLDIQMVTAIPRIHFDLDLMAIGAAKQDHGVLLASPFLTEDEVVNGGFIEPFEACLPLESGYLSSITTSSF